ncbi:PHA/PHB synthase family protein [Spiribacter roseus]|uniref:PHA/PHB synthase family protein n=1 Tax=Spiribacter roseus TaxID=1855875 RepID=UPI001330D66A|nr:alpha/beta fold hydrolase [Spiribacter roseus]KAF0283993.1 poly-beta-hydroxybutyrate polymerase [Spiribacter roseus]
MTRLDHAFSEQVTDPVAWDRLLHAMIGRMTGGISPTALQLAFFDWAGHLALNPGRQGALQEKALRKALRLAAYSGHCLADDEQTRCIEPLPDDQRFEAPAWGNWPFSFIHQAFLLQQQWWHVATTGVPGVNPHHEEVVNFTVRQMLDMVSPSNFLPTNPEVLERTVNERGANLLRGGSNWLEDVQRELAGRPQASDEDYQVGRDLAVTPGKVVHRNALMELIQYEPTTDTVHPEPVLIVPAWIMKYYILDLQPGRSLIEYLVGQGHTVFVVSWKNPGPEDRGMGMADYRRLGVNDPLDVVNHIVPDQKVHGVGYCLGGTLLTLAAAAMARHGDDRLATLSLLATQTDFTEPGELDLFIDESQVSFLEDVMWARGYLGRDRMAGAFHLLRSQDLVWSRMIRHYLMGERDSTFDLMAWNADATRLPYRMHSEYLRSLFLHNDLVEGRYDIGGQPVSVADIDIRIFSVATQKDHIAPWHSVYKITRLARTDVTFLLTRGGHNAGIVSEPGHPRRHYQVRHFKPLEPTYPAERFERETPQQEGSWWPAWQDWLAQRSGQAVAPPSLGAPSQGYAPDVEAPGEYVLMP